MKKWFLLGLPVAVLLTTGILLFVAGTETGLRWLISSAGTLSGGTVAIGSGSGTLLHSMHLNQIRYSDGSNTFLIDALEIGWKPWQLIQGEMRVQAVRSRGVHIDLGESESSEATVLAPITLPLRLVVETVTIDEITLASGGQELQRLQAVTLTDLVYQGQELVLSDCTLRNDDFTLQTRGSLRTDAQYLLTAEAKTTLQLQGYGTISAIAKMSGPFNRLNLSATLQTPANVQLEGELLDLLGTTTWKATLTSREIHLPQINPLWPDQRFHHLTIRGNGSLEAYTLTLAAQAGVFGLDTPVAVDAELRGDEQGMEFSRLQLSQGRAFLAAQGSFHWAPHPAWHMEVRGEQLDPSVFLPQWPGNVGLRFTTKGQLTQSLLATAQLSELQGTLRTFPFSGSGEVTLNGEQLTVSRFQLRSGGSTLSATGSSAKNIDLALHLQSGNLAELWPEARGTLDAHVRLSGRPTQPDINLRLAGSNLNVEQNQIEHVTLTGKGSLVPESPISADIELKKAAFAEVLLDKGLLELRGTLASHSLALHLESEQFSAACTLQGSLKDDQWRGTLTRSHFAASEWGHWNQQKGSQLMLSPSAAELQKTCLTATDEASLCVNGNWRANDQSWKMQADMAALPLSLLNQYLPSQWSLHGRLTSNVFLQGRQQQLSQGKLTAETTGMHLTTPSGEGGEHRLDWQSNALRIDYTNDQLRLVFNSNLNERNALRGKIRQSTKDPVGDLLKRPAQGTLHLYLQDLGEFAALSNQVVIPSGALQGQWDISGLLTAPRLSGKMELIDGAAEIPALGITLAPLQFRMQGDTKTVDVTATARSGGGELQAVTTVHLTDPDNRQIEVKIVGENFHAAQLPGMQLTLSPDLILTVSDKLLDVQGRVTIPRARITSIDLEQATVPSNDVVVIDETIAAPSPTNLPLTLAVDILLGKEVHIDAYGLRGDISGNLKVTGQPGRPQTGTGTLSVNNGSFTLYGKRLKINVGRLLFTGGPLTNPAIELRSENKTERATTGVTIEGFLQRPEISFYSTPAMEQAAIVNNLLQDTAIGGETREDVGFVGTAAEKIGLGGLVPYLRSLKKLSMIDEIKLETGDDYEEASLVFGSWLTPDFYVSYGTGAGEESGTFNTKLNLGKGFSLLTETGAEQSGGDIKYEFEH
jgi:translocation and assembly module TamB